MCAETGEWLGEALTEAPWIVGYILALVGIAAGAAAQASIGMGLNLFAVPVLALIDPVYVPGPVLMHSFLLAAVASYRLRGDINVRELRISLAGLCIGTAMAAALLLSVSSQQLPRIFGVVIVAAVAVTAAGYRVALSGRGLITASAAAGIMGTIAGVHGPPIALLYQHESPARIRSALLPFFTAANLISLLALAAIGMFGWRELVASAALLPGLAAGYFASPWLIRVMSPRMIRLCILAISAVSGLLLAIRG
ncbi:MAG: sulfite exporter TauE/SafE family protein [Hyphomicrobiaceae bacterium]|nr:MAG: sulfite exporter TauE/SafE family protein [Hyphomicrobiaceae bacterium]